MGKVFCFWGIGEWLCDGNPLVTRGDQAGEIGVIGVKSIVTHERR